MIIFHHTVTLSPLEIVCNKPHPFILLNLQYKNTRKVVILFPQQMKHVIIRHAQLMAPRRQKELQLGIQAYLLSVVDKICPLLDYQGILTIVNAL